MAITAEMVKKLRDQTGAGMMDCKKALAESGGDFEKAVTILREKGIAVAAKRESKSATEGLIGSYITDDAKTAVLVELNCETTFVAKTDEFIKLATELPKFIAEAPSDVDMNTLMGMNFRGQTVLDAVNEVMGKVGEKMALTRFVRVDSDGVIGSYIHMGDQLGVLVDLKTTKATPEAEQLAKDIAMHISWSNPDYLVRDEVPADILEKEREVHKQWAIKEGKPEKIIDRIVDGRMKEFYSKVVLLEQPYIKDEEQTIQSLINNVAKNTGAEISVAKYVRFRVGESAIESE